MVDTPLRCLSLFSGYAGLDLAVRLVIPESRVLAYVERERAACELLATRMEDGALDPAPICTDIRSFDGRRFVEQVGPVDFISGGFPCTNLSVAGDREGIIEGNASGLWYEFARVIRDVRPECVFVENVSGILVPHGSDSRPGRILPAGLWFVLGELSTLRFDAEWITLRASDVGAAQERRRTFILAHAGCWSPGAQQPIRQPACIGTPDAGTSDAPMELSTFRGLGELRESSECSRFADRTDTELEHTVNATPQERRAEIHGTQSVRRDVAQRHATEERGRGLGQSSITGLEGRQNIGSNEECEQQTVERAGYGIFPSGQGEWCPSDPIPTKAGKLQPGWISCVDGRAFRIATDQDARTWCRIVRIAPWLDPATEPNLRRGAHGAATWLDPDHERTDRLRMLGNGVVPLCAATALVILLRRFGVNLIH